MKKLAFGFLFFIVTVAYLAGCRFMLSDQMIYDCRSIDFREAVDYNYTPVPVVFPGSSELSIVEAGTAGVDNAGLIRISMTQPNYNQFIQMVGQGKKFVHGYGMVVFDVHNITESKTTVRMSVEGKYVGNYEISMDGIRVISASRLLPNPWKVLAVSIFPIISFIVSCFMFISFVFDKIRHRI